MPLVLPSRHMPALHPAAQDSLYWTDDSFRRGGNDVSFFPPGEVNDRTHVHPADEELIGSACFASIPPQSPITNSILPQSVTFRKLCMGKRGEDQHFDTANVVRLHKLGFLSQETSKVSQC